MFKRMLIPLDGSPTAEQVLPWAKTIAARLSSTVMLFQAIEPVRDELMVNGERLGAEDQVELVRSSALTYLKTLRQDFAGTSLVTECHVGAGAPAEAILEFAEMAHVDLIAMATHGRTGMQRWVYGSVADKVLSSALHPVLLVRATEQPLKPATVSRILVPLDGSGLAERALVPAKQLAEAFGAELVLFRAWQRWVYMLDAYPTGTSMVMMDEQVRGIAEDYLKRQTQQIASQGLRVCSEAQPGPAADWILATADKYRADLIVMSTHGRTGVGRWMMGSVANRVLSVSPIPVLLCRSGAVLQ